MENRLSIDAVDEQITASATNRYVISVGELHGALLLPLAKGLEQIQVYRLKRVSNHRECWRTILVAIIDDFSSLERAQKWSAAVRELLLNNESSDLYLLILSDNLLSNENCINIEADERYCRKYVLRPGELFTELLNRCFLYKPDTDGQVGEFSDPLTEALSKTSGEHDWFDENYQEQWKNAFLSGSTGLELAEMLFAGL